MSDTRDQAKKDSAGFNCTVKDLTTGTVKSADEGGTSEVGNCYSLDPLGQSKQKSKQGVK